MHLPSQSTLGSIRRGLLGLLGDRLGVGPIDKKPPQSHKLRQRNPICCRCVARHTQQASSLPEARCSWSHVYAHPLPSKFVASVKLYYTPFIGQAVDRLGFPRFERAFWCGGRRLSQRHCRGLQLGHGPFFPPSAVPSVNCAYD